MIAPASPPDHTVHSPDTPRASVVMSGYTDLRFIEEAVESVIGQTFQAWELILVDDASGRPEVFEALARRDPRIRVLTNAENLGGGDSGNRGIALARSDIIVRLDADDVAEPTRLERQVAALDADPELGLVGSAITFINEDGAVLRLQPMPQSDLEIRWTILFHCPFFHPTTAFRRALFERAGGYREDHRVSYDHYLWFDMLPHCRARNLPEPLIRYRVNPQGLTVAHGAGNPRARTHAIRRALWSEIGLDYDALLDDAVALDVTDFLRGEGIADPGRRAVACAMIARVLGRFLQVHRPAAATSDPHGLARLERLAREVAVLAGSEARDDRPLALFVTPAAPDADGIGVQQRAWALLAELRLRFRTLVMVIAESPNAEGGPGAVVPDLAIPADEAAVGLARIASGVAAPDQRAAMIEALAIPWAARGATAKAAERIAAAVDLAAVEVVLIHRLHLAPLLPVLQPYLTAECLTVLDLDDDEVTANLRLAALSEQAGDDARARHHLAEAGKYAPLLDQARQGFDVVAVCSETDRRRLAATPGRARLVTVPNIALRPPPDPVERTPGDALRLIFVGALNYLPNVDAVLIAAKLVLPCIASGWNGPVCLQVIGRGKVGELRQALEGTGAEVVGEVDALAPWYARADVALIPLRAGGGTRLKVLEAFAFGVPVVATSLAVEGLEVEDGRHLLIRDDAEAMAEACIALATDPERAGAMTVEARALLDRRYGPAGMANGFRRIFEGE